ncbi:DUF2157 domain-containing protein [Oscillatoria amoena NRMC-F 0135]|nr:DUF2157 domain-containing protein [Geitlerinema splendidum]MDL5048337.1 DUF2157 domain-containing protein [Oscillatoria amoena NRMC-F 0135]
MSSPHHPSIKIEIATQADRPEILTGLEAWLQLGLIDDFQVRRLCRQHFTCPLPEVVTPPQPLEVVSPPPRSRPSKPVKPTVATAPKPSFLAQMVQSLMAELSVRWLLFLGVFLVVVSSGVLAASQWERFPAVGQYGVLWGYTIVFWLISLWADRQANLRLTAQTLRLATLLLIPVNFWAVDTFGLWQSPWNWGAIAIASASLVGISLQLLSPIPFGHLGLSLLHWGWAIPQWPGVAVYLGVGGTALGSFLPRRETPVDGDRNASGRLPIKKAFLVIYALLILLGRAVFVAQWDIRYLGLAIALCGFLLIRVERQPPAERPLPHLGIWNWEAVGGVFIFLGWVVTVGDIPLQAIAVSGLAAWFFATRLVTAWRRRDLFFLWVTGLQACFLLWRILPDPLQNRIIELTSYPEALWGIALLPYLALSAWGCAQLDRQQQTRLVNFGEGLTLILGLTLTLVSSWVATLQAMNLFGSTLILYSVTQRYLATPTSPARQQRGQTLVYLTHITGLLALFSGINAAFPSLPSQTWLIVTLGLMLAEWAFSTFGEGGVWRASAWHLGLGLAVLTYLSTSTLCQQEASFTHCLLWGVAPIGLTMVASFNRLRTQAASQYSTIAIILAQLLTLEEPRLRLVSLGFGFGLMLVNTQYLQALYAGAIAVGLGLGFLGAFLAEAWVSSISAWMVTLSLILTGLWLLYGYLAQGYRIARRLPRSIYAFAVDGWAIALCPSLLTLLMILPRQALPDWGEINPTLFGVAAMVTMGITAYRSWQLPRSPLFLYASILVCGVAQVPLFFPVSLRIAGFAIATLLVSIQTRYLRNTLAATLSVGFSLGFVATLLWEAPFVRQWDWLIVGAIAILILGILHQSLIRHSTPIPQAYAKAAQIWQIALLTALLAIATLHSWGIYSDIFAHLFSPNSRTIAALALLLVGMMLLYWRSPAAWHIYSVGWTLELLTVQILGFIGQSVLAIAIANIILGLLIQALASWGYHRHPEHPLFPSLHILPLIYAGLGAILRWGSITAWTGFTTLGIALIVISLGRRRRKFKPFVYLGMVGISVGAYELLLYQLAQQPGGNLGDGFVAIAALGTTILYLYRLLSPWLTVALTLSEAELRTATHAHWIWSSLILWIASFYPIEATLMLGFGTGAFLVQYALFQGRNHPHLKWGETWVYFGFLEALALRIYWLSTPLAQFLAGPLVPWKVAIASLFAYFLYILPWQNWGWSNRPWKLAATLVPLIGIVENPAQFYPISLLIAVIFYLFLAWDHQQIRYTYISTLLLLWISWRYFATLSLTHPIWYIVPLGCCILYIAQVDSLLNQPTYRPLRHFIRLLGSSLICFTALFTQPGGGITPGILSLLAIFAGLSLRVRAFLLVGTLTFILHIFYQLVILIFDYSFIKWVVGLAVGISLIWIAYNFETRREQINQFIQHWVSQWQSWE